MVDAVESSSSVPDVGLNKFLPLAPEVTSVEVSKVNDATPACVPV